MGIFGFGVGHLPDDDGIEVLPPAPPAASGTGAAAPGAPVAPVDPIRGRDDLPPIRLGGTEVKRLHEAPRRDTTAQTAALAAMRAGSLVVPLAPGFDRWRSKEWGERVARMEPVRDPFGTPLSFGKLAIMRPGALNVMPGPAYLFRMAQHLDYPDGKLVLAYQNPHDPAANHLRPLDEIDGVPVPAALRGKIFAIGSPAPILMGYDQCSDQFLETLARMHEERAALGFDPLTAKATVVGYSEGTLDAPLTRRRLAEHGHADAIGRVVAVSSGANLGKAEESLGVAKQGMAMSMDMVDALGPRNPDWDHLLEVFDPKTVGAYFTEDARDLTDLAINGRIGPGAFAWGLFGGSNNIRPNFRFAAVLEGVGGLLKDPSLGGLVDTAGGGSAHSDGAVTLDMGKLARKSIVATDPHDHAGMVEDPAIVDEILRQLPR